MAYSYFGLFWFELGAWNYVASRRSSNFLVLILSSLAMNESLSRILPKQQDFRTDLQPHTANTASLLPLYLWRRQRDVNTTEILFSNTKLIIFKLHNIYSNLCLFVCVWSFLFDILKVELQEGEDSDPLLFRAGPMSQTLPVYNAMKENFHISISFSYLQSSAVISSENSISACIVFRIFFLLFLRLYYNYCIFTFPVFLWPSHPTPWHLPKGLDSPLPRYLVLFNNSNRQILQW